MTRSLACKRLHVNALCRAGRAREGREVSSPVGTDGRHGGPAAVVTAGGERGERAGAGGISLKPGGIMRGGTARDPHRASLGIRMLRGTLTGVATVAGTLFALAVVTAAEGVIAWQRLEPTRMDDVQPLSGLFGTERTGEPVRFGVMGDSLAVGYGALKADDAPGVILANQLSEATGRPVALTNVAQVGAETTALPVQLWELREQTTPDVVVIIVGANDVMHMRRISDSLLPLSAVVHELRRDGAQVVVATCPDLGTVRPFFQPLRLFAHWMSRFIATCQSIIVLRAGGRTVSLADTLGPLFRLDPKAMFSTRDHLHPSDLGYQEAAEVILPSVCAAVGCVGMENTHVPHRVYSKGSRHPLVWWAFRASRRVGARLTAASSRTSADPLPE